MSYDPTLSFADQMVQDYADLRHELGSDFVWKGRTYTGHDKPASGSGKAYLASMLGINAANSEIHTLTVSPMDFPRGLPQEGDTITFVNQPSQYTYLISTSAVQATAKASHTVSFAAYREGQPDSVSGNGSGDRANIAPVLPT